MAAVGELLTSSPYAEGLTEQIEANIRKEQSAAEELERKIQ